jgi:hypothetical protein
VPATPPGSQVPLTAERIWRTGGPRHGIKAPRRVSRPARLFSTALTVALLAASGVLLYLRFHHAPFHVATVKILGQTPNACGANVTGQIVTNGSAGTVTYQWVFRPDPNPPQRLSQSVAAGQHAVEVTVAVEGEGRGRAAPTVTLQVLGPDRRADSITVLVSC